MMKHKQQKTRIAATLIMLCLLLLVHRPSIATPEQPPETLELVPRTHGTIAPMTLSPEKRRLLKKHGALVFAAWGREKPPVFVRYQSGVFEGVAADYIKTLGELLNTPVTIKHYVDFKAASAAVMTGNADFLAFYHPEMKDDEHLLLSLPWLNDNNVLLRTSSMPDQSEEPGVIGWLGTPQTLPMLQQRYPQATYRQFSFPSQAFTALQFGEIDRLWINAAAADYMKHMGIGGIFSKSADEASSDNSLYFATGAQSRPLLDLLDAAQLAMSQSTRLRIAANWGLDAAYLSHHTHLAMSQEEQAWIKTHPVVNVVQPAQLPPLSFIDRNNQPNGYAYALLPLITERTGLRFNVGQKRDHAPDITAAALLADDDKVSRAYTFSPWVMVSQSAPGELLLGQDFAGQRVMVTGGVRQKALLAQHYPQINFLPHSSPEGALQALLNKEVQAVIVPQVVADYLLVQTRYTTLTITETLQVPLARIGFEASSNDRLLTSILNKALVDISPAIQQRELATWERYRPHETINFWKTWRKVLIEGLLAVMLLGLLFFLRTHHLNRIIQQRKKYEIQLKDQLQFIHTLIDQSPVALFVRDSQLRMTHCNQTYLSYLHRTSDEVMGRDYGTPLIGNEALTEKLRLQYHEILQKGLPQFSTEEIMIEGQRQLIYLWTLPYRDHAGNTNGIIGGFIDVTEREMLLNELQSARQHADRANACKSEFLAQMSHEIRTPMNALVGLLELEVQGGSTAVQREENLRVAWQASRTLLALVGDILDLAKIEAGKISLNFIPLSLRELAGSIHTLYQQNAKEKQLEFTLTLELEHDYILCDATLLNQIISNLISNAIKYTWQGGIELAIGEYADTEEGLSQFIIEVRDSGVGLNEEQQRAIFEPFIQVDEEQHGQIGTGLGLSICNRLATILGGSLTLESEPDQGSTFIFSFKAEPCAGPERPQRQAPEGQPERELTVIIVDDHAPNRLLLSQQITFAGHKPVVMENGFQVLAYLKNPQARCDLLITDCNMPQMDGFTLVKRVRLLEQQQGLSPRPIFGLTALSAGEVIRRGKDAGMTGCLYKPIKLDTLLQCLAEVAGNASLQQLQQLPNYDTPVLPQDDAFAELTRSIMQTNYADFKELQAAVQARNGFIAERMAHRLLGSAQIIQFDALVSCCRQLEQYAQQGVFSACDTLLLECEALLEQAGRCCENMPSAHRHTMGY